MNKPINVLVVDDHPLVRKGIAMCLAHKKHIAIVGEVGDAREAIDSAKLLKPDVVLMDISMPHVDGLRLTSQLREQLPGIKVLILSVHESVEHVSQAIRAGARGYLFKGAPAEELFQALNAVANGETCFSSSVGRATLKLLNHSELATRIRHLTDRERQVLIQIAEGRTNKEIAAALGLSVRTIESHRGHLIHKLNIHSTAGLTRYAVAEGLVSPVASFDCPKGYDAKLAAALI